MKVYGDEDLQAQAKDYHNTFQNQTFQLKSQTYNNALVFPFEYGSPMNYGGVFDENNSLIETSKNLNPPIGYPQKLAISSYKTVDKEVIYLGNLSYHFGHFLVDSLSRFWFLLESSDKTKDLVYIALKDNSFISDILDVIGWKGRSVYRIKEPIKFKSVTIPQPCYSDHIEYKDTCRKIGERAKGYKKYKKIFLSRTKFKDVYNVYGEKHFEKAFKIAGFKIIYPEKISLKEQIWLMKNCEHLAGVEGSALHLSLFCKDGIEMTHILRCNEDIRRYICLDKVKNIKNYYICAYAKLLPVSGFGYPYIVNINDKNFVDYARDNNMDIKKNPKYCLSSKEFIHFMADWNLATYRDAGRLFSDGGISPYVSVEDFYDKLKSIVNVEDLRRQTRPLRNLVFRIFKAKILFLINFIPFKNKRKILRNQALNWMHLKLFHIKYY